VIADLAAHDCAWNREIRSHRFAGRYRVSGCAAHGELYESGRAIAKLLGDCEQGRTQGRQWSRDSPDGLELLVLYVGHSEHVGAGNPARTAATRNLRSTRNYTHGLRARFCCEGSEKKGARRQCCGFRSSNSERRFPM